MKKEIKAIGKFLVVYFVYGVIGYYLFGYELDKLHQFSVNVFLTSLVLDKYKEQLK